MIIATPWSNVDAECCGPGKCGEDKQGNAYHGWCCGCGACNVFCCNCENGCNWGWKHFYGYEDYEDNDASEYPQSQMCGHKKRAIMKRPFQNASSNADQLFKRIDINGNNAINIKEAAAYLKNSTISKRSASLKRSASFFIGHELRKMDTNNDGIISPDEFDATLKL